MLIQSYIQEFNNFHCWQPNKVSGQELKFLPHFQSKERTEKSDQLPDLRLLLHWFFLDLHSSLLTPLMMALRLRMALQLQMSEFCAAAGILFQRTILFKNLRSGCAKAQRNVRSKETYFYFSTEFPLEVSTITVGMEWLTTRPEGVIMSWTLF